jgi:hypothetical protein
MTRRALLLLLLGLGACEEPYYGDVAVAQYRPDDPRVVGPNAFQLRPAPYGVQSPRPVYELRSPVAVVQRQWQDWNTPSPPPAPPPQPVAAPPPPVVTQDPAISIRIVPPDAVSSGPLAPLGGMAFEDLPPVAGRGVDSLPPVAGGATPPLVTRSLPTLPPAAGPMQQLGPPEGLQPPLPMIPREAVRAIESTLQ